MTTQPWDSLYSFPSYWTGTMSFCFSAAIWNPLTPDWMTKIQVSTCYSTERMTLQQDQVNTGFEIIPSCATRNPYMILKAALSSCPCVCPLVSAFFLHTALTLQQLCTNVSLCVAVPQLTSLCTWRNIPLAIHVWCTQCLLLDWKHVQDFNCKRVVTKPE